MDNKPSLDIGILAPIALAVLSILGMAAVFFINRANALRPAEEIPATDTPFRYIYLGTEPGLSTLTPEPTLTPIVIEPSAPEPTEAPLFTVPPATPVTALSTSTQSPVRTSTPTVTETLQAVQEKYDDVYSQIVYVGNWTPQSNVTNAYRETLHVSFQADNYLEFTFVGEQVINTYQIGPGLGEILITIDGLEFPAVSQSNGTTTFVNWPSPILVVGTHSLTITHLSGGSVNIDAITIPELSTATPTP